MTLLSPARLVPLLLAISAPAQWDPDLGQNILDADEATSVQPLGFAFPLPGGVGSTSSIFVSTNGWVKLTATPASHAAQFDLGISEFLGEEPRIAVYADDLDSSPASDGFDAPGVFFRASPGEAVVTWRSREFGASNSSPVDAQLHLFANGSFAIRSARVSDDALIGVSSGAVVVDPGAVDLSAGLIGGAATMYERFSASNPMDLVDTTLSFTPSANGYDLTVTAEPPFVAASSVSRGSGCPSPSGSGAGIHERFAGGAADAFDLGGRSIRYTRTASGYDVTVTQSLIWQTPSSAVNVSDPSLWQSGDADDGLSHDVPLGFLGTYWSTSTGCVQINPNGVVYFGNGGGDFVHVTTLVLAAGPPALAVASTDLDLTAGGTLFVDRLPAVGQLPAKCVVTWQNVPRYDDHAETVTAQAQLFANGDVLVSFLSNGITRSQLTGFFEGGGTSPAETDLSTLIGVSGAVASGAPRLPLLHSTDWFALGSEPVARVDRAPPGAIGFALHVGLVANVRDLAPIGMPGCSSYTDPIVVLPMTPCMWGAETSMGAIPVLPALIGGAITTQGVAVAPGVNPLGITSSNAVDSILGF